MLGLKPAELLLILALVFLLFGGKKLPELGRGVGDAIRGFKRAMSGEDDDKSIPATAVKDETKELLPAPVVQTAAKVQEPVTAAKA